MIKLIDKHFEEVLCVTTFLMFVALSNMQVISRYALPVEYSFAWTEEIARYLFVWSMLLGISWCIKDDSHLRVDMIKLAISPSTWKKIEFMNGIIILFVSVVLFIYGYQSFQGQRILGQTLAASDLPIWMVHLSIPVSSVLVAVRCIQRIVNLFRQGV